MIKKCPYCGKVLDIPDAMEPGQYLCPYEDCSKTFIFYQDASSLHKTEEPPEESPNDKAVIVCPNPDCKQELRILKTKSVLQVVCPKCHFSFRYPPHTEKAQRDATKLLSEFDIALEDEIKAVKTRGGDRMLVLKDGKFIREMVGGRVYQFNLERKIPVPDETPAQIEIMGRDYRASIVRFLEFKLEVRIADFDGERIPSARLKIEATYVLRKLKDALSLLASGSRNVDSALKVFNRIPQECSVEKPVFTLLDREGRGPDPFQAKAIEACLGNEVAFIHGPPGTGKTRTLVNIVNDLANNAKRVLVSCYTNIACDNVMEHLVRYSHEKTVSDLLNSGQIVRVGTPILQNEQVRALTIEAIHERLSKELLEERDKLATLEDDLVQKDKRYYEYKQTFEERENLVERIADCEKNISVSEKLISKYTLEKDRLNESIYEKKQLLSIAENRVAIINFFKRTRRENIRFEINNLNNEKMEKIRSRDEEEKRLNLLSDELKKLNTSFSEKSEVLPENMSVEQIENVLRETQETLEQIKGQIIDINNRISKLNEGLLANAKIIVSTLAKTFTDPALLNLQPDVVVIDEASIAPLPMLFYVCSLAKEKVLIYGDPRQLPPIKLANTVAAEKWLKNDIFQEAGATRCNPHDPRVQSLRNQYRMHEEIFRIVNTNFYDGELRNRKQEDKESKRYDDLIPRAGHRAVIIDTSNSHACMSTERTGAKSWSRYNLYHIQILEKVLHDLMDEKYLEQKDIGIITPYRGQASFVREMLIESGFKNVDFGTVHSFQGIEKKYIILDLVEAPGGKKIGVLVNDKHEMYLGKEQNDNKALRLLAVAFSRPKEKLVIVSHNEHMVNKLPRNSTLRRIITDLTKRKSVIDGSDLVPYYVPVDDYPDTALFSEEDLAGKEAVFNQRSFYPHLIKDLKNAKKEVIFVSGYMSTNRIEKLMPHFTSLLSRGINIKIFTKPPREQMSREQELKQLHQKLRSMGIEIYQHYGTHEKVVAIDSHILYAGSLNVLSFNHSSNEMMIRANSKPKLQKVFSVLAKNYPKLEDYLVKSGYVVPEQPMDLTPEKFQSVLDSVRPKYRELPKSKQEAGEYYTSMLTKLRWIIADDKRIPNFAVLFTKTIKVMFSVPPATVEELLSLPEFRKNKRNIRGYENTVLEIVREYREVTNKIG